MAMLYGVHSILEPDVRLTNGFQTYDWVARKNRYPQFWGRPISGDAKMNAQEADFLHDKGCKIALLYTRASEESV